MYKFFSLFIGLAFLLGHFCQLIALIAIFMLTIYVLYVLFSLANLHYLDSFVPYINGYQAFVNMFINVKELNLFQQQLFGMAILAVIFGSTQIGKIKLGELIVYLKNAKENCRRFEDKCVNDAIHRKVKKINKKMSKYLIYLELKVKDNAIGEVNLDTQYKLLNEFLFNKLEVTPSKYAEGYLYRFANIEAVDDVVKYFMHAMKSNAPVDYKVVLQVIENGEDNAFVEIFKLKGAGLYNVILMSPTTCVRYEHNDKQEYVTGIIGNYLMDGSDISIYELREKFF